MFGGDPGKFLEGRGERQEGPLRVVVQAKREGCSGWGERHWEVQVKRLEWYLGGRIVVPGGWMW